MWPWNRAAWCMTPLSLSKRFFFSERSLCSLGRRAGEAQGPGLRDQLLQAQQLATSQQVRTTCILFSCFVFLSPSLHYLALLTQIPGLIAGLPPLLPITVRVFVFIARRILHFVPSSTRKRVPGIYLVRNMRTLGWSIPTLTGINLDCPCKIVLVTLTL